jgi:hypothetical protein
MDVALRRVVVYQGLSQARSCLSLGLRELYMGTRVLLTYPSNTNCLLCSYRSPVRKKNRRKLALGGLLVGLLVGMQQARAASMCTNFAVFDGTQEECLDKIEAAGIRAGLDTKRAKETVFFWFNINGAAARCMADRGLITLFAYHLKDNSACPLVDRVRDILKNERIAD